MQTIQKNKIKTYLPIFPGFYETWYSFNEENYLEAENQEREEKNKIEFDDLEVDEDQYENDISIKFCEVIAKNLENFVYSIEFENIYSPKEYNFSTDSINCIIEPKTDEIKNFINTNKGKFSEYLKKKYTSYDGFISHYSNNFDEWQKDTNNFTKYNSHNLGSILEFIHSILEIEEIDIYYNVTDDIWEGNYITINK